MNNNYRTRELSLAAFLISSGLTFISIEAITRNSYWFVFEDQEKCYKFEKRFLETKEDLIRLIENYQKNYADGK